MITFFTTAKPFTGHNGVIQQNALKSWRLAAPDAEVILFGDEEGTAETARELGIRHVAEVERTGESPKKVRSFFDAAQRMARHELVCYANCDIVLSTDFLHAVNTADALRERFLMAGRKWNVNVKTPLAFAAKSWKQELTNRAIQSWEQSSGAWIDYFVFRRGFYLGKIPEMVIGRVYRDQWLCGFAVRLEMNHGAQADLDVILRAGIEPGVHVIGFGTQRDARIVGPVNAATGLKREAVLALPSDLGIQMNAADKRVSPRGKAFARRSKTNAAAAGEENIFCAFAADLAAPSGDYVAFETKPRIEVVGQVRMQTAEICAELHGIEMDIFVADGEIPAIAFFIRAGALG
jgi:hypothetical protein